MEFANYIDFMQTKVNFLAALIFVLLSVCLACDTDAWGSCSDPNNVCYRSFGKNYICDRDDNNQCTCIKYKDSTDLRTE